MPKQLPLALLWDYDTLTLSRQPTPALA